MNHFGWIYILAHCMHYGLCMYILGRSLAYMHWMYIYRCCHFFHIKINEFLMRQYSYWKHCFSLVMKLCKWGWRGFQRKLERNSSFFFFSLNYVSLLSDIEKCKSYNEYVQYTSLYLFEFGLHYSTFKFCTLCSRFMRLQLIKRVKKYDLFVRKFYCVHMYELK